MKSPAFQFYPKDWLASQSVSLMTLAQEGAYIRLLAYAWLDENCSIPNDIEKIQRMLRLTPEEWDKGSYNLVISNFKQHCNNPHILVNDRLLEERQKQAVWRDKCASGGRKSAAKRWGTECKKDDKGSYKGRGNYFVTLQFAVCSLHILLPQLSAADIYEEYPKKVGKPKAITAISKAKLCPHCLLERVKAFAASCKDKDPQFIPHPATWFNQERYNDDPATWKSNGGADRKRTPSRNDGTYNETDGSEYDSV